MKIHRNQAYVALLASILALRLVIAVPLRAQVSGATLSGNVADAQGGNVPNAKVSVRNVATGTDSETVTNSAGLYSVPNLNAGDYEVSVSAAGFSTAVAKVTLAVGAKQELNIPLAVGQMEQSIQVTTEAPQVELTSSTIGGQVNATTVRELPLNGRDWASLATLQPTVVEARTHLDVTHAGGGGGRGFGDQLSIGGGRPTQNSYRLDGAIVNDYSNAGPGSVLGKNLGVDAIQEFSVLTNNYSAEYGFTSGGVINAVTKSGTNAPHGTAFDFLRNDAFDARNFFTNAPTPLPKNALHQNQFGGAAGYRIKKDKLFLFGDYEGVRKSAGLPVTNGVTISDAVRAGTVTNITTAGRPTTTVAIDPNIAKYLALFPHPTPGIPLIDANTGFYNFVGSQLANENFVTGRGDYKLSQKDSVFATYLRDNSSFSSPLPLNVELQSFISYRQAVIAEETHVFGPSWVNTLRVAEDRTSNLGGHSPTVVNPAAGDPTLGQLPGFFSSGVTLTGTGVTTLVGGKGGGVSVQDFFGQIFQVYNDAFHQAGTHGLKFGFMFIAYQDNGYTPLTAFNGTGTFSSAGKFTAATGKSVPTVAEGNTGVGTACYKGSGSLTSSSNYDASCGALVNFLTDQPNAAARPFDPTIANKHYLRDKIFAGYIQDDWRARRTLTLNLGLRYEMSTIPTENHNEIAVLPTPDTILPCGVESASSGALSCPAQSVMLAGKTSVPGDPRTVLSNKYYARNPTLKNFEPRIGFAWDVFGDGKTSLRAGFGVFDALPLPYELLLNNTSSAPFRASTAYVNPGPTPGALSSPPSIAAGTATTTAGEWPSVVPSLSQLTLNPLGKAWLYIDNNIKRNYTYQINFSIQRQLTSSTTITVGYAGSRGFHNPFQADTTNTVLPVNFGNLSSGVGYYWPGCLPPQSAANCAAPWSNDPSLSAVQKDARLLNPSVGTNNYSTLWQSRSWYDALHINLVKRMSHGFQVQGAFTWSKSEDDSSGSTAGDTFQLDSVSEPFYDLGLDKGLSDFNVGRNLVINGTWLVPSPKTMHAFENRLLGGWELGTIITAGDGVPINPTIGQDILGEVVQTSNPIYVAAGCTARSAVDPNYRHDLTYLNASCVSLVPQTAANTPYCDTLRGTAPTTGNPNPFFVSANFKGFCPNIRGNLGRNSILGPGLVNVNASVFKNNPIPRISEAFNVQFRAEMFNLFNRTNFAPSGNQSFLNNTNGVVNPTFEQLTSTQGDNRIIQLALKVIW